VAPADTRGMDYMTRFTVSGYQVKLYSSKSCIRECLRAIEDSVLVEKRGFDPTSAEAWRFADFAAYSAVQSLRRFSSTFCG
jgi:hypothetical protein